VLSRVIIENYAVYITGSRVDISKIYDRQASSIVQKTAHYYCYYYCHCHYIIIIIIIVWYDWDILLKRFFLFPERNSQCINGSRSSPILYIYMAETTMSGTCYNDYNTVYTLSRYIKCRYNIKYITCPWWDMRYGRKKRKIGIEPKKMLL